MAQGEDASFPGSAIPGLSAEGLDRIRRPIGSARHLPGAFYFSPEIEALEKQNIFMKDWLCVARVEELANPGDYMAFRVMGEPAIVVRDDDGVLRAFSNSCAHRGVEVIRGEGNTGHFQLPLSRLELRSQRRADRRGVHGGVRGVRSRTMRPAAAAARYLGRLDLHLLR